jgi:bifunctional non-homologous end joining protein LigD
VERRTVLDGLGLVNGWAVPPAAADGEAMLAVSLEYGLEGVIAKRANSRYRSGRRTRDWIKVRHNEVHDTVVVGWTRRESGGVTLLLAEAADGDGLFFVGRCTAPRSLVEALAPLAVREPPVEVPGAARGVQWVRPVLEVEVSAASRTPDGRLRQPRLRRVRLDQW